MPVLASYVEGSSRRLKILLKSKIRNDGVPTPVSTHYDFLNQLCIILGIPIECCDSDRTDPECANVFFPHGVDDEGQRISYARFLQAFKDTTDYNKKKGIHRMLDLSAAYMLLYLTRGFKAIVNLEPYSDHRQEVVDLEIVNTKLEDHAILTFSHVPFGHPLKHITVYKRSIRAENGHDYSSWYGPIIEETYAAPPAL